MELGFRKYVREEDDKQALESALESEDLCFLFTLNGRVFGAPEESRLTYARMKSNDEDKAWTQEANFSAVDIAKAVQGEDAQRMFSHKDLKNIKIISKEDAEKILRK